MAEQHDRIERDKPEGDRGTAPRDTPADETGRDARDRYTETSGEGGGITNRPLDVEIDNQDALPPRGSSKDEDPDRTSDSDRGPDR